MKAGSLRSSSRSTVAPTGATTSGATGGCLRAAARAIAPRADPRVTGGVDAVVVGTTGSVGTTVIRFGADTRFAFRGLAKHVQGICSQIMHSSTELDFMATSVPSGSARCTAGRRELPRRRRAGSSRDLCGAGCSGGRCESRDCRTRAAASWSSHRTTPSRGGS